MQNQQPTNQAVQKPTEVPHFLSTVVTPLDKRVEMKGLPKMCSCFSFGS